MISRMLDDLFVFKLGVMLMVAFYTSFHSYITFCRVHFDILSY
jgi:hypothetical protein